MVTDVKVKMFQSTPVIANGRIGHQSARKLCIHGFNPRPLLLTGESDDARRDHIPTRQFQSTPVIANGRIRDGFELHDLDATVSIHARYC